jgi:N-acetylmuramate 1-kinase
MLLAGEAMDEPLETAALLLADMTTKPWPAVVEAATDVNHRLSAYDEEAQLIEVDLMPSWYVPFARGTVPSQDLNQDFAAVWRKILPLSVAENPQWVLRDFHSPNLLWIPERQGLQRVGLIDTQDALMGHPAYDLVSMIQDARVDIDPALADRIYKVYVAQRHSLGGFSEAEFATAYAVLGAQRATKILGIFARLNKRDGKPGYLRHMPRVSRYLVRNLEHPALAELKRWYLKYLPEALSA